jgi:HEAT repeat protein
MQALQRVADQRAGTLVDSLLDRNQPPVIRRRLARILSACQSQSAADGLFAALGDDSLDVRVQCARALFRIQRRAPAVRIQPEALLDHVRTELAAGAPDLAHVFTLLALVLPVRPLRAAYRGLRGSDPYARGTALEYLAGVLPQDVRKELLGVVEGSRR